MAYVFGNGIKHSLLLRHHVHDPIEGKVEYIILDILVS